MTNKNASITRNFIKVYFQDKVFHDDKENKDISYTSYFVMYRDERVKLKSEDVKSSTVLPFVFPVLETFVEELESGKKFSYYKIYVETVIRTDEKGNMLRDEDGFLRKYTRFYCLLNGKRAYFPAWCIKYRSADGSKSWDLETMFKAAVLCSETYTPTADETSTLVDDGNVPF